MFTKLAQVRKRYLALRRQLEDGSVYADPALAARLLKEQKELQPVAETYALWERARADLDAAAELQKDPDPDMRAMADEERRAAMGGALKAAMLLAGVFIAAGALVILGMQLLWS